MHLFPTCHPKSPQMKIIALLLSFISLIACDTLKEKKEATSLFFNQKEFTESTSLSETANFDQFSTITLNYSLEQVDGTELAYRSCEHVSTLNGETIAEKAYVYWQLLHVNCTVAKWFFEAKKPIESYLNTDLSEQFFNLLPAQAIPDLGGQILEQRSGKTIGEYEKSLKIKARKENHISVVLEGGLAIDYDIMARGDFNNDGIEDIALRLNWSIIDAFGSGVSSLQITRTGIDQPISIIKRFPY